MAMKINFFLNKNARMEFIIVVLFFSFLTNMKMSWFFVLYHLWKWSMNFWTFSLSRSLFMLIYIFRITKVIVLFILNGYPSGSPYPTGIFLPESAGHLAGRVRGWYGQWKSGTGMGYAITANIRPRLHP